MERGLFIAFEGIDGCGKSMQAKMLADYIFSLDKHNHVLLTREPWKNQEIRKILKSEDNPYSQGIKLSQMFIADRKEHVSRIIIPNLQNSVHVISDRYSLSTLAYQQAQGIPLAELLKMHKGLLIPDIIFIIDVPVNAAVKRMKKDIKSRSRKSEQKFEKNRGFMEKLRKNYLKLAELNKHNIVMIDGTRSPEEIFKKQIKPVFDKVYNNKPL